MKLVMTRDQKRDIEAKLGRPLVVQKRGQEFVFETPDHGGFTRAIARGLGIKVED